MFGKKTARIAALETEVAQWKQLHSTAMERASHNHDLWKRSAADAAHWQAEFGQVEAEYRRLEGEVSRLLDELGRIYGVPQASSTAGSTGGITTYGSGLVAVNPAAPVAAAPCPDCQHPAVHDTWGCPDCTCMRTPWTQTANAGAVT